MTPCSHPAALRFLRLAVPQRSLVSFAPWWTSAPPRPGVGRPVSPAGNSLRSEQGSPKFLGNHDCPFAMFQTDAGRTVCTQTIRCNSVALGHRRAKAPTKGLSTLNSIAFGLAVYASQCGLLQHHARLASSCWSSSTGRAFHPQGSVERFQSCRLHLIPLSQTSWRNRCDRSRLLDLPVFVFFFESRFYEEHTHLVVVGVSRISLLLLRILIHLV